MPVEIRLAVVPHRENGFIPGFDKNFERIDRFGAKPFGLEIVVQAHLNVREDVRGARLLGEEKRAIAPYLESFIEVRPTSPFRQCKFVKRNKLKAKRT